MNWMHYLVEANLYLAAFYALYLLFLRGETHYQLNRAYLLGTSALAFVIPFIQVGILKPAVHAPGQISIGSLQGAYGVVLATPQVPKWTMDDYILLAYGTVALALLIHLLMRVYLLMALLKKGSVTKSLDFNIIELRQGSVAFSFFNNLFIDDRLASSQTILRHEQVHIRQKHSWDIIYFELLKIINWFNPVVYLLIASIKEVHEFIADEETARLENNNDSYTDFLISNAYGITQNSLTNSFFNNNLLKRRITMLYQKKSGKAARLKYLLTLPLMAGLLCLSTLAFTTKTYGWVIMAAKPTDNIPQSQSTDTSAEYRRGYEAGMAEFAARRSDTAKRTHVSFPPPHPQISKNYPDGSVWTSADRVPEFIGGEAAFAEFLKKNIHYPAADKQKGIQGRVFIRFVVSTDGSLYDYKVLRTPSKAMGDEAIRVMKLSPKWKPGLQNKKPVNVEFTLPINFALPLAETTSMGSDAVYTSVDIQPQFPGGMPALNKFVQTNVRYPKADHDNKVQGKAFIQFIVEQDGSVDNLKVLRAPSDAMGTEATRVMASSPKWQPGMQNGKPVRVEFTMPINFALSDDGPQAPFNINIQPPAASQLNKIVPDANPNAVYTAVEVQPEFPGGEAGLGKFLQQNIRYPALAKQNKIQGKVYVQFVVEKDGSIADIKVLREPGSGIGDEAVRVMKLSPKWIPGKQNGQPVRVQFTVPINFALTAAQ